MISFYLNQNYARMDSRPAFKKLTRKCLEVSQDGLKFSFARR
jgi:hypothetical protein